MIRMKKGKKAVLIILSVVLLLLVTAVLLQTGRGGSYTDRDGNKRYTFDVVAENVEFCESKEKSSESKSVQKAQSQAEEKAVEITDYNGYSQDLPF